MVELEEELTFLKALAAGATACSFGKMFLFALGAGGQPGVERLLQICMMKLIETWY
jgi:isopentenyl diphosphate isomerase/L-lactate dehydrogenase-like FMN-dependent dehydrogenase